MGHIGQRVMPRCYNHIIEHLSCFMFCQERLYLHNELIVFLDKGDVVGDGVEFDIFFYLPKLESVDEVVAQMVAG